MTSKYARKKIGMVGIGGSGMQALAYLLSQVGATVTGTDKQLAKARSILANEPYGLLDEEEFIRQVELFDDVIFSDAVDKNDPLRLAARSANVENNYQEAAGDFASGYKVIAITGTHGKSSTSAMAAHIMIESGLDPTVLIGAAMPQWQGRHARLGRSDIFLIEADEYREHFLALEPYLIGITAIDFDHPDYFKSLEQTEEAYSKFIRQRKNNGLVITLKSIVKGHPRVEWPEETVVLDDAAAKEITVNVPGRHMKANGLIAKEIAIRSGADPDKADDLLATYGGLSRRFERLGKWQGMEIISDYGHHPTEIASTLAAAREKFPGTKIVVLFEPHTQERLQIYRAGFVDALRGADGVILTPIFMPHGRSGSEDLRKRLSESLVEELKKKKKFVTEIKNYCNIKKVLKMAAKKYAVAIAFSAGYLDDELRKIWNEK